MKNILILPTDKPSRLHLWTDEIGTRLELCDLEYTHTRNTQNIYITSDELPKLDEWGINTKNNVIYKDKGFVPTGYEEVYCRKIILTTDQDLIKDGVQAIDDEFLEWFVKNTSCEEVKIELEIGSLRWSAAKNTYKIIIPKQEPKQEFCDNCGNEICCCILRKQETLEEVALKYAESNQYNLEYYDEGGYQGIEVKSFAEKLVDFTTKWQQKRRYSEEDMHKLIANAPKILIGLEDAISLLMQTTEFEVLESFKLKVGELQKVLDETIT